MDRQERIDLILDHYENPRCQGVLPDADVVFTGGNPGCGDEVTIYLQVNGSGQVGHLRFQGRGCTISQAAASMVMEMVQGWTVGQIAQSSVEPILEMLGPDIAAARLRCATLALNAVKDACTEYQRRERARLAAAQQD